METFTPTLDWGNELVTSLLWVAKAWVIGAVCMLAALALIARFTKWGSSSGASPATISRGAKAFQCGRLWACCCCR
jgi:hypothetical protein